MVYIEVLATGCILYSDTIDHICILSIRLELQSRTKPLRHFSAIFSVAPCNHRVQKEQTRPPPHPWCNAVAA